MPADDKRPLWPILLLLAGTAAWAWAIGWPTTKDYIAQVTPQFRPHPWIGSVLFALAFPVGMAWVALPFTIYGIHLGWVCERMDKPPLRALGSLIAGGAKWCLGMSFFIFIFCRGFIWFAL